MQSCLVAKTDALPHGRASALILASLTARLSPAYLLISLVKEASGFQELSHMAARADMRKDILEREAEIREWVSQHLSKAFMCRELRCKPITLDGYLKKFGLNYQGNRGSKGKTAPNRNHVSEFLFNGSIIKSFKLKLLLLRDGLKAAFCEQCLGVEWMGKPMPLELHHINGNPFDNRLENIQVLCPNCHALTDNHAGRGIHRRNNAGVV